MPECCSIISYSPAPAGNSFGQKSVATDRHSLPCLQPSIGQLLDGGANVQGYSNYVQKLYLPVVREYGPELSGSYYNLKTT